MRVSAKADYALRAIAEVACAGRPLRSQEIARAQGLPLPFLEQILVQLKRSCLLSTSRGFGGGYRLTRPATSITVGDVLRAVDGPLIDVHDQAPERLIYLGPARRLRAVWMDVEAQLQAVLDGTTLADLTSVPPPTGLTNQAEGGVTCPGPTG